MNPERQIFLNKLVREEFGPLGDQPWPVDALLFEPHENEQALLYEFADCLSVRALLIFAKLPVSIVPKLNTEHMSPSGELPLLKVGKLCVSGFTTIQSLLEKKGYSLSQGLPDSEVADMQAAMSLITSNLKLAEMYICWCHKPVLSEVTLKRYGSVYAWPLNTILPRLKENEIQWKLGRMGLRKSGKDEDVSWMQYFQLSPPSLKDTPEVLDMISKVCQALSVKLGSRDYFCFDDKPTELDALVFGHLFTILTTELTDVDLAEIVKQHRNLIDFCKRIERLFFSTPASY